MTLPSAQNYSELDGISHVLADLADNYTEVASYDDHERWLEARNTGIGASEIAVIVKDEEGRPLSRFKSPLDVWALKTGHERDDDGVTEIMDWGNRHEPTIAKKFEDETGRTLLDAGTLLRSKAHPWAICTPDRWQIGVEGKDGPGVLEIKNTSQYLAEDWEDGPPAYNVPQIQFQMMVTGARWGSFAVLIGGNSFRWFDVERDEEMIAEMASEGAAFWQRVLDEDPPHAQEGDKATLYAMYPEEEPGKIIQLDPEVEEWSAGLAEAKADEKDAKSRKDHYDAMIRQAMGDAERGNFPDGSGFTLKTTVRKEHMVKASQYRTLRAAKAKK